MQWERTELSADKYVFQNLGTGQWIAVNGANVRFLDRSSHATHHSANFLEPSGHRQWRK
jgi:hypothetical protein